MKTKFFTAWALRRLVAAKGKLTPEILKAEKVRLMKLPNAQKVAAIAATEKRLELHRRSCEQAYARKSLDAATNGKNSTTGIRASYIASNS